MSNSLEDVLSLISATPWKLDRGWSLGREFPQGSQDQITIMLFHKHLWISLSVQPQWIHVVSNQQFEMELTDGVPTLSTPSSKSMILLAADQLFLVWEFASPNDLSQGNIHSGLGLRRLESPEAPQLAEWSLQNPGVEKDRSPFPSLFDHFASD
ncbi:MAG: hypothetical protein HKN32_03565 [Flavobacteriales bacterium]|nr:hypothetical protein [Flavobacteriales bacterium]